MLRLQSASTLPAVSGEFGPMMRTARVASNAQAMRIEMNWRQRAASERWAGHLRSGDEWWTLAPLVDSKNPWWWPMSTPTK